MPPRIRRQRRPRWVWVARNAQGNLKKKPMPKNQEDELSGAIATEHGWQHASTEHCYRACFIEVMLLSQLWCCRWTKSWSTGYWQLGLDTLRYPRYPGGNGKSWSTCSSSRYLVQLPTTHIPGCAWFVLVSSLVQKDRLASYREYCCKHRCYRARRSIQQTDQGYFCKRAHSRTKEEATSITTEERSFVNVILRKNLGDAWVALYILEHSIPTLLEQSLRQNQ